MIKNAKFKIINNLIYVECKKASFPFNIILWIFKKTMCKADSTVSMINPFTKNIYTIIDNNSIVEYNKPYIILSLYLHEYIHLVQVYNDGLFKFLCKYMWYNIRYGYRNNLYEVQARQQSTEIYEIFNKQYLSEDITNIKTGETYNILYMNNTIFIQYKKD